MKSTAVLTTQQVTTQQPTTKATQRPTKSRPPEVCTSKKSKDILFMVDSTVNVTESVLQRMKDFINYSMARFNQLDESFMMGIMQFSDESSAEVVRKMSKYTNREDLEEVLKKMESQKGLKRLTGDALVEASKTVSFVNMTFWSSKLNNFICDACTKIMMDSSIVALCETQCTF